MEPFVNVQVQDVLDVAWWWHHFCSLWVVDVPLALISSSGMNLARCPLLSLPVIDGPYCHHNTLQWCSFNNLFSALIHEYIVFQTFEKHFLIIGEFNLNLQWQETVLKDREQQVEVQSINTYCISLIKL